MALSPRAHRRMKIEDLQAEMARQEAFNSTLPRCRTDLAESMQAKIQQMRTEIDRLNEPYILERPRAQRWMWITSGAMATFGMLFGAHGWFMSGLAFGVVTLLIHLDSPQKSPQNLDAPMPTPADLPKEKAPVAHALDCSCPQPVEPAQQFQPLMGFVCVDPRSLNPAHHRSHWSSWNHFTH